jgi:hypothetical protein
MTVIMLGHNINFQIKLFKNFTDTSNENVIAPVG